MFDQKLLDFIRSNLSELNKVKLSIYDYNFPPSLYDEINSYLIYRAATDSNNDNIALFHPTDRVFLLQMLVTAAFGELLRDITDSSKSIENNLKYDDYIVYKGVYGQFKGAEFLPSINEKRYRIFFGGNNNDIQLLRNTDLWQMQICTHIDNLKLKGFPKKLEKKAAGSIISEILEINKEDLSVLKNSRIALLTDKKDFIEDIKHLKINGFNFTHLFPTAKLITTDNSQLIQAERQRRNPVIYIATNFEVLYEFILRGNAVNMIIADGTTKTLRNMSTINMFVESGITEDFIALFGPESANEAVNFETMGFKTWLWKRRDIEILSNMSNDLANQNATTNIVSTHLKSLSNLSQKTLVVKVDDRDHKEAELLFTDIKNILNKINKYNTDNNSEINTFLSFCYRFLIDLQTMPFPIKFCEEIVDNDNLLSSSFSDRISLIRSIGQELLANTLPDRFSDNLEILYEDLESLKNYFNHIGDYKINHLIRLISNHKRTAIILRKKQHVALLEKWLENNNVIYDFCDIYDSATFKKIQKGKYYDLLIFTFWLKDMAYVFDTGISPSINFILYPFETDRETIFKIFNENVLTESCKKNRTDLLGLSEDYFDDQIPISPKEGDVPDTDLSDMLNNLTKKGFSYKYAADNEESVSVQHYIFEEDLHAFFTNSYKAKRFNRNDHSIERVNVANLKIGDEIIFLKDSRRDIFDELVSIIEQSDELKNDLDMAQSWKHEIRNYMDREALNIDGLTNKLRTHGCKKHPVTVKNWLTNDKIIGPEDDKNVFDAVIKMTSSTSLKENLDDILDSISKLRSMHIKLGRYLARCIVAALTNMDDNEAHGGNFELDDFFENKVKELSKHAYIVQISYIDNDSINIPKSKVNRLLEMNE